MQFLKKKFTFFNFSENIFGIDNSGGHQKCISATLTAQNVQL